MTRHWEDAVRYCDGEPGEFEDDEFTYVRGNLYLHVKGRRPLHTNDGAPYEDGGVVGPSGPVIGPDSDSDDPHPMDRQDSGS